MNRNKSIELPRALIHILYQIFIVAGNLALVEDRDDSAGSKTIRLPGARKGDLSSRSFKVCTISMSLSILLELHDSVEKVLVASVQIKTRLTSDVFRHKAWSNFVGDENRISPIVSKYGMLPCMYSLLDFGFVINIIAYQLERHELSSPSAKELHKKVSFLMRVLLPYGESYAKMFYSIFQIIVVIWTLTTIASIMNFKSILTISGAVLS